MEIMEFINTYHIFQKKAHIKSFIFFKNQNVPYNVVHLIWMWLCFLIYNQLYVVLVNGAIYLIATYNCLVNKPSCYVINQQKLQLAA